MAGSGETFDLFPFPDKLLLTKLGACTKVQFAPVLLPSAQQLNCDKFVPLLGDGIRAKLLKITVRCALELIKPQRDQTTVFNNIEPLFHHRAGFRTGYDMPKVNSLTERLAIFKRSRVAFLKQFGRDEDGSIIVLTLLLLFGMLIVGGMAVDFMRYESRRAQLQSVSDRAVLAAAD